MSEYYMSEKLNKDKLAERLYTTKELLYFCRGPEFCPKHLPWWMSSSQLQADLISLAFWSACTQVHVHAYTCTQSGN